MAACKHIPCPDPTRRWVRISQASLEFNRCRALGYRWFDDGTWLSIGCSLYRVFKGHVFVGFPPEDIQHL